MRRSIAVVCYMSIITALGSCKHETEKTVTPETNYPPEVSAIITTRCATAGCHNAASYQTSGGGLLMDSWEHMFDGGNTGAVIIPYNTANSSLLYFTNSHPDLGPVPPESMRMPYNLPPLSREEYLTLREWVAKGAPDKDGNIPFASNKGTRQKIYVCHQGCDYVAVIDAEKKVVMRYIPVGHELPIEGAQSLAITHNGNAGYVGFWGSQYLAMFNTADDTATGRIDLQVPNTGFITTAKSNGNVLVANSFLNQVLSVDAGSGGITQSFGSGFFVSPHGVAINKTSDTFFVTEQYGNTVHKLSLNGYHAKLSIDSMPPTTAATGKPNPYNIVLAPDDSRYFLTCTGTDEVRVMDAHTNALLKVIHVGKMPQGIAVSKDLPYLFVSCMEDTAATTFYKGSVYIINYETYEVVKKINDRYYMPNAMAVDDHNGMLYVFSRNLDPNGPPNHHGSADCDGRHGYYSVYDFKNLKPFDNKRYEVTVDPISAEARFK